MKTLESILDTTVKSADDAIQITEWVKNHWVGDPADLKHIKYEGVSTIVAPDDDGLFFNLRSNETTIPFKIKARTLEINTDAKSLTLDSVDKRYIVNVRIDGRKLESFTYSGEKVKLQAGDEGGLHILAPKLKYLDLTAIIHCDELALKTPKLDWKSAKLNGLSPYYFSITKETAKSAAKYFGVDVDDENEILGGILRWTGMITPVEIDFEW